MSDPLVELQSIHSMLSAGHRSVRLERHSLLLIGALGGFLSLCTDGVITLQRFPDNTQRALALLIWLAAWLGGVSVLDHWLTSRARQRRAETMPFAQAQITRAWWMLLSVGALGSFAMFFYGGGQMVYALWIVLLGLGIYLFGLFSRPLVEWIGVAAILLGVMALAERLPFGQMRWLCACSFTIGIPLAGWLALRTEDSAWLARVGALCVWICAVVAPALWAVTVIPIEVPSGPAATLGSARQTSGQQTLHLEPGTRVPLELQLEGPVVTAQTGSALALTTTLPIDLALTDGQFDGRYRLGDAAWRATRDGGPSLLIDAIHVRLESGRPVVGLHARLNDRSLGATRP
jgi:hypothetical protein